MNVYGSTETRTTVVTYLSGDTITVDGVPVKNSSRVVALKKGGYNLNGKSVKSDAVIVITDKDGVETTTPKACTSDRLV